MNSARRFVPMLATVSAGLAGAGVNLLPLPLLGSGQIVLAGFAVLPVAWLLGPGWGALAAAIAYSGTLIAWQHGWGVGLFVAEAIVAGWLVRSRGHSPFAASLRYWAVATPVAGVVFGVSERLPFPLNWITVAAFPASGLLAALLAINALTWLPASWQRDRAGGDPFRGPLARSLFRRFASLVAVPLVAVALAAGHAFERHARRTTSEAISVSAHDVAGQLDAFLREHQRAVTALADVVYEPGAELQDPMALDGALFQLRRRYPAFTSAIVANANGAIIAASPAVDGEGRALARVGKSVEERDYFRAALRSRQPFTTGAFRGLDAGSDLQVAVSAPVLRAGRVVAIVVGSIDFARFGAAVRELPTVRGRNLVVVDAAGYVVLALGAGSPAQMESFGPTSLKAAAAAAPDAVFFHDETGTPSASGERMLAAVAEAGLSGWQVYLEEPWWRSLRVVAGFHGGTLLACGLGLLGTLLLARRAARAITAPLQSLAHGAHELAEGRAVTMPRLDDAASEIAQLANDVGRAAQKISAANQQLVQTVGDRDRLNTELTRLVREMDETVRERTADLAAKNDELQGLFEAQREAQLELAESDHRYRVVLESLTQIVFQADAEGNWTFLSPAWKRITGYSIEASLFRPVVNFFHPDDHARVRARLAPTADAVTDDSHPRVRCRHRDGGYRWVEMAARPTVRRPGVAGTLTDVTELIEREEALRLSRERFELAVRGSGAGLWDWDLAARTIYFSPRAHEILGFAGGELADTRRAWLGRLHPAERGRVLRALQDHIVGRSEMFEEEFRLRRKDGSWCWVLGRGAVLRDQRGRGRRLAGSLTDISELKGAQASLEERSAELSAANAQLGRAARLKDEFLAAMSHELRTPLNSVLGMSEVLLEGIPGPVNPAQRDCVQTIAESGRHLLELINDILDLSKIEAGKLTLDRGPVVVTEIVQASLRFVKEAAQKKGLKLNESYQQRSRTVYADARRLKQILLNLLSNAVKFTPTGGRVGIEVGESEDGEALTFTVWDSGIGIPVADQARLFQPFVQVDSKLSRNYGGTGLGLAIVRRLAELHGGGVTLVSTPGEGSRFTIALPLQAAEEAASPAAEAAPTAAPDGPPLRVLLVEDHETNIAVFVQFLEARQCALRVARTGLEALELARAAAPEVVILDLQMPGMDGFETLRQLRADVRTAAVPIVIVTALNMPGDRERCLAAGANAFLTKPVPLRALHATLLAQARTAPALVAAN